MSASDPMTTPLTDEIDALRRENARMLNHLQQGTSLLIEARDWIAAAVPFLQRPPPAQSGEHPIEREYKQLYEHLLNTNLDGQEIDFAAGFSISPDAPQVLLPDGCIPAPAAPSTDVQQGDFGNAAGHFSVLNTSTERRKAQTAIWPEQDRRKGERRTGTALRFLNRRWNNDRRKSTAAQVDDMLAAHDAPALPVAPPMGPVGAAYIGNSAALPVKRLACPSHCCPVHGCKYGYDDCPVELLKVIPTYPYNNGCESCESEPRADFGTPETDACRKRIRTARNFDLLTDATSAMVESHEALERRLRAAEQERDGANFNARLAREDAQRATAAIEVWKQRAEIAEARLKPEALRAVLTDAVLIGIDDAAQEKYERTGKPATKRECQRTGIIAAITGGGNG